MPLLLGGLFDAFYDGTKWKAATKREAKNESIGEAIERLGFMICKMVSIVLETFCRIREEQAPLIFREIQ